MSCERHIWRERPKKPGEFQCTSCHTLFPCKELDCGHLDCLDFRRSANAKNVCTFCRKPVQGDDPAPNVIEGRMVDKVYMPQFRYYTLAIRGSTKVAHSGCVVGEPRKEVNPPLKEVAPASPTPAPTKEALPREGSSKGCKTCGAASGMHKCCSRCKATATDEASITAVFGWRRAVRDGKNIEIPQSWCLQCKRGAIPQQTEEAPDGDIP